VAQRGTKSILKGFFDGAAEGVDVELAVDVPEVGADGFVAQVHSQRDFLGTFTAAREVQEFNFAIAQVELGVGRGRELLEMVEYFATD